MGCHMCPLFKTMPSGSNTSSPASPTEPGDSDLDLDDGWDNQGIHLPWLNESNMLQVPTPIRKSSLGSHETGLSPTEGSANMGDIQLLCTASESSDSHGAPDSCVQYIGSQWPVDIDVNLLAAIHGMEEDMHPARFHGLFEDEDDCEAWAQEEGVDANHAVRIWAWSANTVFLRDKTRDRAIREDRLKMPQSLEHLQVAKSVPLVSKRFMPVTLTSSTDKEIRVTRTRKGGMSKEDKAVAKLESHKEFMYDLYMAAGPRGQHWLEIHNEEEMEERREVILSKLDKFTDPSALSGKKSNWRRWEQWAKARGVSPFEPRELEVARYIRSRSGGGHTAANGVFQALLFLESYVGVRLHTSKQNIISMGERKPRAEGVPSKQAEIATPSIYLRIFQYCKQKSDAGEGGTVVVLGMMILAWMVACIRAKHAQTSWVTKVSSRFIHWWCPEGKRRVQGVRIPFAWLIPRILGPDLDVWPYISQVYDALKSEESQKLTFFIPDVDVVGWQDLNASTPWVARAMPYDKMSKMLRGMCVAVGVSADWAAMMTTYTPRRFGPTCCGAMGYDEEQMQALSSWQEIPQHQDKKPGSRARFVMSRHYDGSTDLMSGDLKGVMVVALHYSFKMTDQPEQDIIEQNHLDEELKILRKVKSGGVPDELEQQWMSPHWEVGKDEDTTEPVKITVQAKHEFSWDKPGKTAIPDNSEAEDEASEGSGSSSDSSEEGSQDPEDEELALSTGWFIQNQGGPTHFVWSQTGQGLPVPLCRKPSGNPFSRTPYMCGTCNKLDDLAGVTKGAHLPCLMLAPPAVQAAWRQFAGDNIVHPDISDD